LAFTLYPPGYAPYRRQALLALSPDGRPIGSDRARAAASFEGTLFEAAIDAERARAWPRESGTATTGDKGWGTQGRHLRLAARLVGISSDLCERVRETIAAVLSVDSLLLREHSRAKGYRALGTGVCAVLARLTGAARRAFSLLVCGHLIGRWGEPLLWDEERKSVLRSPFLIAKTIGGT